MAQLSLTLLGPLGITLEGQPVSGFAYNKARALLAYLAVEADRPHHRDTLVGLLWPELPDTAARTNLRQALANLREAIGDATTTPPFLLITRDTLQFNPVSDYDLDVAAFGTLFAVCETHTHRRLERCRSCAARLEQAIVLYRGDFLAEFSVGDSAPFEEWQLRQRERLHQQALEALVHLADYHECHGDGERARQYAQRQIELEPWREEAHRQLMRLLARDAQRSAASAQYETCRRILARDLGVEPATDTTVLYERIRDGASTTENQDSRAGQSHHTRLPVPPTPLIGRERELGGPAHGATLARMEREQDNLRAALGWNVERAAAEAGLQLCITLQHFWSDGCYRIEALQWFRTMLAIPDSVPVVLRAETLSMVGELAAEQGDTGQAIALLEEALALCPQIDDPELILNILGRLAYSLLLAGSYSRAALLFEECLVRARGIGSKWHIAWHLRNLGRAACEQGDFERAKQFHEESLALFRQLDAKRDVAWGFFEVSTVACYQGDYSHAVALAEESLALFQVVRDKAGIAWMGGTLGWVALKQGDVGRAVRCFAQGLMAFQEFGDKQNIVRRIEALASASAQVQGQAGMAARRAARLFGAASALRDAIGMQLSRVDRSLYEPDLAATRAQLDEAAFAAAWAGGRALSLEQAITCALEGCEIDSLSTTGITPAPQ